MKKALAVLATVATVAATNLMPASGHQDHTTSPSASAPFVKGAFASTASRSDVRDDRETPLCEAGRNQNITVSTAPSN